MKLLLRRSRFGLGQALLAVLTLVLIWMLFVPWIRREGRLLNELVYRNRFARNTSALKTSSVELTRSLSSLRKQIALFSSSNTSLRGVEIMENIRTTAMETGVVLTGIESGGEENKGGVVEYLVKAQARGSYNQLGSWISKCMRAYPHVKIQTISLKRNGIGSGPNLAQVDFVFCFPKRLAK